ncbi:MAG: DNA polymerase III subunit chi [Pikeienuella sp.]
MAEIRFYQLLTRPLEAVLPVMLQKSLARGWRSVVRAGGPERLPALDRHLWTWSDESFLPHGRAGAGPEPAAANPIWLTTGPELPNAPAALFLVDGAEAALDAADLAALSGLETVAILFDGTDQTALGQARAAWRQVTGAGLTAVYWAEAPGGGWERKAESGG